MFKMTLSKGIWLKIAGTCGILTPIIAFTLISFAITYSPSFSWTENALSDLGIQKEPTATLFNFGLITSGITATLFASGLYLSQNKILAKTGALIFILATIMLTAIGVFPENVKPTHYYVSVTFFTLFPIAMLTLSAAFLFAKKTKMGIFTFLTALSAATVWVFHWTVGFGSNVAIPEALSAIAASVWAIVLGFKMPKAASQSN